MVAVAVAVAVAVVVVVVVVSRRNSKGREEHAWEGAAKIRGARTHLIASVANESENRPHHCLHCLTVLFASM